MLQPVLVAPNGDSGYRLIAGEGRYLAAAEAGCTESPALVRDTDERTGGLELALAENLAREDLDPVEQARGFQRLRDAGLTKKGIAERLGVSQRLVTERMAILELPEELHPQIADGTIPPGAIRALVALARIHPGLPTVAARRVGSQPAHSWDEPLTWSQVADDPVAAVIPEYEGEDADLPPGVYEAGASYPVGRFSLSEKAERDLAALCELIGCERERFAVRFGREAVEQALSLAAAHASAQGWHHLIVGQDVADQLAGDYVAACLKKQRAIARREREERKRAAQDPEASAEEPPAAASEEELKDQRRREREAERERRRAAHAFNAELGAAVLKHLARLKVDDRVLKVLTAVDVASDLGGLAARGARYGFPGWPQETTRTNGTAKVDYSAKDEAAAKAREFLAAAKTPADIAGRTFCLIAMARYANEADAVANSNRSFYELRVGTGLPWSADVVDLVDRISRDSGLDVERFRARRREINEETASLRAGRAE